MVGGMCDARMDHRADLTTEGEARNTMGKSKATKPTRDQKAIIMAAGLIWQNWLVLSESDEELHIVSRGAGVSRTLKKPLRVGRPSQRHK